MVFTIFFLCLSEPQNFLQGMSINLWFSEAKQAKSHISMNSPLEPMISNSSSSPIDWVQVPAFTELGCSGASQRHGEPISHRSKLHLSESKEERLRSLVARGQESQDLVLALPTPLCQRPFFPSGNSKALFKTVISYNDKNTSWWVI